MVIYSFVPGLVRMASLELRPLFEYPKACPVCHADLGQEYIKTTKQGLMHIQCYSAHGPAAPAIRIGHGRGGGGSLIPPRTEVVSLPKFLQTRQIIASPLPFVNASLKPQLARILATPNIQMDQLLESGVTWADVQAYLEEKPQESITTLKRIGFKVDHIKQLHDLEPQESISSLILQKEIRLTRSQWTALQVSYKDLGLNWSEWMNLPS